MVDWTRVIAHVDMDAFYASVEVRDDPSLAGKPVAVGGAADRRGVVSSASYEARRFGVRSAMPMAQAVRRCPGLVVIHGDHAKYTTASRTLRRVFAEFSPAVEPLSLDEAFLDLTGTRRLLGEPREIGVALRRRIRKELALTASVGLADSKFVAKLASAHAKPDGLVVVPPDDARRFVQSLPLDRMWGVGPATRAALQRLGVRTMAALAAADPARLSHALGGAAERWIALAEGRDDRPVVPDARARSLSRETTFPQDVGDAGVLEGVLLALAESVARRARRAGFAGRTVQLKVRLADFTTLSRSRTLAAPTSSATTLFRAAADLFRGVDRRGSAVRLLGVGLAGLVDAPQLELFGGATTGGPEDLARRDRLDEAEDSIVARFGAAALARARTLVAARDQRPT
ncbi:MAG: DNA polymerase IV [Candidatus Eiseniibacteriota bacterium]